MANVIEHAKKWAISYQDLAAKAYQNAQLMLTRGRFGEAKHYQNEAASHASDATFYLEIVLTGRLS